MGELPFVGKLTLGDCITLGVLVLLALMTIFCLKSPVKKNDGEDFFSLSLLACAALFVGFVNFAANWLFTGLEHAWRFGILWPGVVLLPLLLFWGARSVIAFVRGAAQRKKHRADQRYRRHLQENHDQILGDLRVMSDAYKAKKTKSPE